MGILLRIFIYEIPRASLGMTAVQRLQGGGAVPADRMCYALFEWVAHKKTKRVALSGVKRSRTGLIR